MLARLTELVEAAGIAEPDDRARDIVLIYEGVFAPRALGLDPGVVERARRLAARDLQPAPG